MIRTFFRSSPRPARRPRRALTLAQGLPMLVGLGAAPAALAQTAPDPALPAITVQAESLPAWQAAAQAAEAQAQSTLDLRAGGTSLTRRSDYAAGPSRNLADVMAYTPGVAVNMRHGDETRFSIRGSGLQRGFLLRGIQLYQDGVPLNHADGAGDFQALDPLAAQYVEVWRGANALEYGANALGGAVNFVSPTGRTAAPALLRLQAGSFGARQAQGAFAFQSERADGYLSVTRSLQDGWREQSGTQATRIQGNVGWRIHSELEARLFLSRVESRLQMPGSLTRAAYDANPRQAAANYVRLNAVNHYDLNRVAARLSWTPSDALQWTTTVHASDRQRFHAMVMGVLQNDFSDTGFDTRVVAQLGSAALPRRLVAGLSYQRMHGDQTNSSNNLGFAGARTGASTQTAKHTLLYAEYTHGLAPGLALQAGAQAARATRDYVDRLRPAGSYDRRFDGFSPKLAVLYDLAPASQLYANLSRGFEAPPFGELVLRNSYPMAWAQKATTVEAGWRHRTDALTLDATVYRSQIRGELLALNDAQGVALGTVNADRTTHQGVELAATWALARGSQLRLNYLYNDFRFDADAVYADRRLAGIAPHLLNLEYRWQPSAAFWIAPALEVRGGRTWIDHANTVSTGGFALLNLGVGGAITRDLDWFVQGRNLGNRKYVSSTAVQADVQGRDGGYYFPGDRRSVYAGLEWRLR